MKARQNLKKRARQLALRSSYNASRASFGDAWERLHLRMGHTPFEEADPRSMVHKIAASNMYGKFATTGGR